MQKSQIAQIIAKHINHADILSWNCDFLINNQIHGLSIIFKEDITPDLTIAGNIMHDIDDLTVADEYGDMTECTFKYTTMHTLTPDDGNLYVSFFFDINIDS